MAIIGFEHAGGRALGFDTGLTSAEFARMRQAALLEETGLVLTRSGGRLAAAEWRPGGVVEREGRMVIWGAPFSGERLDLLVMGGDTFDAGSGDSGSGGALPSAAPPRSEAGRPSGKEGDASSSPLPPLALSCALRALALYAEGRAFTGHGDPGSAPGAVLVGADGASLFFAPAALAKSALLAGGAEAWRAAGERWVHPDAQGEAATNFTLAALLYAALAGCAPFDAHEAETLHTDIREGVFLPLRYAAPGVDEGAAAVVDAALKTPAAALSAPLRALPAREAASFFPAPPAATLAAERAAYAAKQEKTVRRRRFLRRNRNALTVAAAALLVLAAVVITTVRDRLNGPSTRGMEPLQVAQTYYTSLSSLQHEWMSACLSGKAGEADVNMATYLFVMDRTRQAYEMKSSLYPAEDYLAGGVPPEGANVFGITGLRLSETASEAASAAITARYVLWYPPENNSPDLDAPPVPRAPARLERVDTLHLAWQKDRWRIVAIDREESGEEQ